MKTKILSILILSAVIFCALTSCAGGNVASSGEATIVVDLGGGEYATYTIDLSQLEEHDEGAFTLLKYLSVQKGTDLYYSTNSGGGYGAYITAINSLSPDPMSEYIAVYTSEKTDFSVSSDGIEMPGVTYNGTELKYSGVGISQMTIKDGTVVMFRLESFA